jgi:hypothetical protein
MPRYISDCRTRGRRIYVMTETELTNLKESILKGSDDGVSHLKESGFWTLSIAQCFLKEHNVSEKGSVPILGTIKVAPTLLGPLERASLNQVIQYSSYNKREMVV